jgi:hypothetical protein
MTSAATYTDTNNSERLTSLQNIHAVAKDR